ncbi:MAG: hypothetical protein RL757_1179 [Bacteroidota bacterium]|jgi:carboxymethylenebutenolidase
MKKCFLFLFTLWSSFAAAQMTCCGVESMADYQLLGKSLDFASAHAEPLPFEFVSDIGKMVTFDTPDGKKASGFVLKANKKSKKWLFVYQEWWGLNGYIKKQASDFYTSLDSAVNVLAIDMYDGQVTDKREEAGKLMSNAKPERLESIMRGAVKFVGKKASIASVGWCFGGGLSLKSAIVEGKQAVGCIMYYGMPIKETKELAMLKTDVVGFFAGKEKWINKEVVETFAQNMKTVGKELTYTIYDAEHAFANPSNPNYDKKIAAEAYEISVKYLKKKFKL